jgi:release factor glutamine methyltransferase
MEDLPIEYLDHSSNFCGCRLYVDERVLIPRPETELLVEQVHRAIGGRPARVLDVGTGSGCISAALAVRDPQAKLFAVDVSPEALAVAARNTVCYPQVYLVNGDLTQAFKSGAFDVVVANLPYVETAWFEKETDLHCEPRVALDGGVDGLDVIRRLLGMAGRVMAPGAVLFLEIGWRQRRIIEDFVREVDCGLRYERCVKDEAGHDRIVVLDKR